METTLKFDRGSFDREVGKAERPLQVADSWLVIDGKARALDRHESRFTRSCRSAGISSAVLAEFWPTVVKTLPRLGRWFPRVELTVDGTLRLRLRPAPPLGSELAVWCGTVPDERVSPRVKGPDLAFLARMRAVAESYGSNEALIRTSDGWVVEGATTSLLWWEDDVLCFPATDLPALPGVTTTTIQEQADRLRITRFGRRCRLEELTGREVWMVNALHGIRPVTGWVHSAARPGPPQRAVAWRSWLAGTATQVEAE